MEHAGLGAWGLVISMPTCGQAQEGLPLCISEYILPPKEHLGKNQLWHEETLICWGGIMGLFWSNSWSLALIFCTHAKKNPTLTRTLSIKILFLKKKKLPDHFSKTHIKWSIWILYFFKILIFFIYFNYFSLHLQQSSFTLFLFLRISKEIIKNYFCINTISCKFTQAW